MRKPALAQKRRAVSDLREIGKLEVGYWMIAWAGRKTPEMAARIYTIDHEPGDPENILDTGPVFVGEIAGLECDPFDIASRRLRPISEAVYRYRAAEAAWLRQYQPEDPKVQPRKRVNLKLLKVPF